MYVCMYRTYVVISLLGVWSGYLSISILVDADTATEQCHAMREARLADTCGGSFGNLAIGRVCVSSGLVPDEGAHRTTARVRQPVLRVRGWLVGLGWVTDWVDYWVVRGGGVGVGMLIIRRRD
jgi:hypothetical protein